MSEPGDLDEFRRAFAAIPAVAPAPDSCPPSEVFLAAVRGEQPPAALRELIDHIATCPACAEDWRLAVALERPAGEEPAATSPEPTPWRARRGRLLVWCSSAAAAAAIAIGGFLWEAQQVPPTLAGLRGGGETVQLLTRDDVLPREACLLRWKALPGATYDLDVTYRGRTVKRAYSLRETQYRVPAADLTAFPLGTELAWRVTAHLPHGHLRSSVIGKFILR